MAYFKTLFLAAALVAVAFADGEEKTQDKRGVALGYGYPGFGYSAPSYAGFGYSAPSYSSFGYSAPSYAGFAYSAPSYARSAYSAYPYHGAYPYAGYGYY